MSLFSPETHKIFEALKDEELLDQLVGFHKFLLKYKLESVEYGDTDEIKPERRTYLNLKLLQQIQLHRTEKLLTALDPLILSVNVYGLALFRLTFVKTSLNIGRFTSRSGSADIFSGV